MSAPTKDAAGAWVYPESWSPENQAAWEGTQNHLLHELAALARAEADGAAALESPEVALAAVRAKVDEAKRARERAERQAAGEKAWILARAEHGDGVARIDMEAEGDVLIVHFQSDAEIEAVDARADRLQAAAAASVAANAPDADRRAAHARGLREAIGAQLDAVIAKTQIGGLDDTAARVRVKAFVARYAGLRPKLFATRDALITGFRRAEGKGSALS